ncbi:MAG: hypothetical protein QM760_17540 [Nibricoccus sp.]
MTLNTEAFARAIAALEKKGGGTLVVPPGIWHTRPIALKSRINLHVEAGALIQFSRDTTLYPLRHFHARGEKFIDSTSPLSGDNLEDIAITGGGVIDGGGDAWRLVKKAKMTEGAWKALVESGGVLSDKKTEWFPNAAARATAAPPSPHSKRRAPPTSPSTPPGKFSSARASSASSTANACSSKASPSATPPTGRFTRGSAKTSRCAT